MSLERFTPGFSSIILFTALCFTSCEKEMEMGTRPKQIIDLYIDYSSGQTDHMSDSATYMVINWNNGSGNGDMYEFKNYSFVPTSPQTVLLYFTKEDLKIKSYSFTGGGTDPGMAHLSYMILPSGQVASGRPVIDYTQMDIIKMYKVRSSVGYTYYVNGKFRAKMAHGTDSLILHGSFQGAVLQSTK